jgi:hypothetical protein
MSGVSVPNKDTAEANDLLASAIRAKITDAEFSSAKAALVEDWGRRDVVDRWLDTDTYKTVSFSAEQQTVSNLSIADVQRAADILQKQPVAVVVVNTPKTAN